jgi:hypothetical protein
MNRKSRLNNSKLKNFVYSLPHQSYLNNQPRQGNDKIFNLIDNSYYKNSHFPAAYARDLALVLKRATNALGRNFSDLEAKFNKHVNQSL